MSIGSSIGSAFRDVQKTFSSGGLNKVFGGGLGPEGDGGAGERAAAEEARKTALRKRIDRFYGIGDQTPIYGPAPVTRTRNDVPVLTGRDANGDPIYDTGYDETVGPAPITGYQGDPEATAAKAGMEAEKTKLADATRAYYTDQLGRDYTKAERNTRFKLARQGLLGGSEDIFQQGEVNSDRDLGATRVDEAVRRAVGSLESSREDERLKAISLVNAGAGDDAVLSAQAGLRNSLSNVSNAQKQELFGDLFSNSADAVTLNNLGGQQAALLGRYRDRLSTFFPASGTSSGRVTPTS